MRPENIKPGMRVKRVGSSEWNYTGTVSFINKIGECYRIRIMRDDGVHGNGGKGEWTTILLENGQADSGGGTLERIMDKSLPWEP